MADLSFLTWLLEPVLTVLAVILTVTLRKFLIAKREEVQEKTALEGVNIRTQLYNQLLSVAQVAVESAEEWARNVDGTPAGPEKLDYAVGVVDRLLPGAFPRELIVPTVEAVVRGVRQEVPAGLAEMLGGMEAPDGADGAAFVPDAGAPEPAAAPQGGKQLRLPGV